MSTPPPEQLSAPPSGSPPPQKKVGVGTSGLWQKMLEAQNRERKQVLSQVVKMRGFMPLLMKPRNGQKWSAQERAELQEQLRALAHVSPYLVVMLLPGSFAALPVLAWWLDRRRQNREEVKTVG